MIIAATGHRPHKLGGYSPRSTKILVNLAKSYLIEVQPESVISGMAQGWDQAFATAAIHLGIPLTCAVPFYGQESRWPDPSKAHFFRILDASKRIVYVSEGGYSAMKMQVRNEWMVDNATDILALWDGTDGGTHNCIRYAQRCEKPIRNLWPVYAGQSDVWDVLL